MNIASAARQSHKKKCIFPYGIATLPSVTRNDTSLLPFVPVFSPVFFYFKRLSLCARNDTKEDLPLINL